MKTNDVIRTSTEADLQAIDSRLKKEDAAGIYDNFLCNWAQIEQSHQEGKLLVYVDAAGGEAVGFQFGSLLAPGSRNR